MRSLISLTASSSLSILIPLSLISFIILKIPTLLSLSSALTRLSSIFFNRLINPIFLDLSPLANPSVILYLLVNTQILLFLDDSLLIH